MQFPMRNRRSGRATLVGRSTRLARPQALRAQKRLANSSFPCDNGEESIFRQFGTRLGYNSSVVDSPHPDVKSHLSTEARRP